MLRTGEIVRKGQKENYKIKRPIGKGNSAFVYLADDLILPREVALKVVFADPKNSAISTVVLNEAQHTASLNHLNILKILDFFEDDDHNAYMVMPYAEGGTLAELLQKHKDEGTRLSVYEVEDYFKQMVAGVNYAHGNANMVHRDLKPQNMLFLEDRLVISDFGLAKVLNSSNSSTSIAGTFSYMSPESLNGNKVGLPVDVYALGIILYELLAGEPPFVGSPGQVTTQHLSQPLPNILDVRTDVTPELQELLEILTAKHPKIRPRAGKIVAMFDAALSRNSISTSSRPAPTSTVVSTTGTWPISTPATPQASSQSKPPSANVPSPNKPNIVTKIESTKQQANFALSQLFRVVLMGTILVIVVSLMFLSLNREVSPKLLGAIQDNNGLVLFVAWSPDGKILAFSSNNNTVKLWSLEGKLLNTLIGHTSSIWQLAWSVDSKVLASASLDNTVKLWNTEGKLLNTLIGHTDRVLSVSWSPDGKILASGSFDNTIKMWDTDGKLLSTLIGYTGDIDLARGHINSIAWSPDSKILAAGFVGGEIKLWSVGGQLLNSLIGHKGDVNSVVWSPNDKVLASASDDGTIKLWNAEGKSLNTLTGHMGKVYSVAWSPDGAILAAASDDKTIRLWSREGKLLNTITGHTDVVRSVTWSPDSKTLASSSNDGTIKLWKIKE